MSISLGTTYTCQECGGTIFAADAQGHMSWHAMNTQGSRYRQPAVVATTPTTATDRKLAPGWRKLNRSGCCYDDRCPSSARHDVLYARVQDDPMCGLHAEDAGAFAVEPSQPVPDAAMRDMPWGKRAAGVGTTMTVRQCRGEHRISKAYVDRCQLDEGHVGDHAWPSTGAEEMIARQRREMLDYRAHATSVVIDEVTNIDEAAFKRLCSIVPDSPRWSRQTFAIAKPVAPPRCATCTHVHAGPCNGTSPNGEFACPCGNLTDKSAKQASSGSYAVGTYGSDRREDLSTCRQMIYLDTHGPAEATLLANLAREKPPGRRPIRTVARYEGNSDE